MLKWFAFITIIFELEYFLGHYIFNNHHAHNNFLLNASSFNNSLDYKINRKWIGPLSILFNNMVFVLDHLVSLYFYTFNNCFLNALSTLNSLIYGYYHLLEILIITFLHFPTNIICIVGLYISLMFSFKIIKCIFNNKKIT